MENVYTALPPLNKMCLIVIWVETVLYGINCVMYSHCMYTLLHTRNGKIPTQRWVLLVASTLLILLCTAHVGASLQQLLDAFVYAPPGVPDYSTKLYWLNLSLPPRVVKDTIYVTLIFAQHSIQIWRLHVVFMRNWKVTIVPVILLSGCLGSGYAAVIVSALPHSGSVYGPGAVPLAVSSCVLIAAANIFITVGIVMRLWWMGHKTAPLTDTSRNRFTFTIYVVIESGAISAIYSTVFLVLAALGNPASIICLDILAQMDALTPFLIIVQVQAAHAHRRDLIASDSSGSSTQA